MDYKDIAKAVRICGSEPSVRKCEKECPYYKGGDTKKCIPPMTADVAAAITDLLARAEAAEARVHELETTHRTEMCSDGYDCVQLGKARKAEADAEARAENAEKEIKRLRDIMWNKGFVPFPADDYESEKEE